MTKIEILTPKRENQYDSFFYCDQVIATAETDKYIFSLIASGDIRVIMKDGNYYENFSIDDCIIDYKLTEDNLEETIQSWENNNWFEVVWCNKQTNQCDCDLGKVVFDYDDAIELLKYYVEEDERFKIT